MAQHQGSVLQQRRIALDLRLGCLGNLIDQQLALSVQARKEGSQDASARQIVRGQ